MRTWGKVRGENWSWKIGGKGKRENEEEYMREEKGIRRNEWEKGRRIGSVGNGKIKEEMEKRKLEGGEQREVSRKERMMGWMREKRERMKRNEWKERGDELNQWRMRGRTSRETNWEKRCKTERKGVSEGENEILKERMSGRSERVGGGEKMER